MIDESRFRAAFWVGTAVTLACIFASLFGGMWIAGELAPDNDLRRALIRTPLGLLCGALSATAGFRAGRWWLRR